MDGTELLILQACNRVVADEYGFVFDDDLARHTQIPVSDVRSYLELLEKNDFISLVRLEHPDGLKAHIEAKGRTELTKRRSFQEEPKEKQGQAAPIKVIPKGLRSYEEEDAYFFLELLPGTRDRDGLPESIRYWKIPIERTDADRTFPVGLIYGPSGCGKSSLVKAGLYQVRKIRALLFHGLCRLGKIDWASEPHQELDRCLSRTITASKNFND